MKNIRIYLFKSIDYLRNRLHVLPAFIPPMESEYFKVCPKDVLEFREKMRLSNFRKCFSSDLSKDGLDLYGLDLLIG